MSNNLLHTNRAAKQTFRDAWNVIDMQEMQAFFGLLIFRGIYRATGENCASLWSTEHGRAVFPKTMTFTRFKHIRRFLRFDNPLTRTGRLQRDKLAAVRLLLDGFTKNSMDAYMPGINVTVDEQLYPFRGRCIHRQNMPAKPAKYGLKFWLLCDEENFYCYNREMYTNGSSQERGERGFGEHVVCHYQSR